MILLGLGANLPSAAGGPRETLLGALQLLDEQGVRILARSPWYRTAPVPASDQPWYWNAAASVATGLPPDALLAVLHAAERNLGRVRGERNAARSCDLDILDYEGRVSAPGEAPVLPHP